MRGASLCLGVPVVDPDVFPVSWMLKQDRKVLDSQVPLNYIPPMFTSTTVILLAGRKTAWHLDAVAEGGFY
jgi:hypothetical protein